MMIHRLRTTGFLCAVLLLAGCGEDPTTMDTRTYHGAFNMIVAEVENLNVQVNFETYRTRDNPVEDQLGSAIIAFMSNEEVKGTPLEIDAQILADQEQHIREIWKSGGSVEEIRAAAKEMQDQVDLMKATM